ncbi:hypothetical protein ACLOJK_034560 [Asimina triloba]
MISSGTLLLLRSFPPPLTRSSSSSPSLSSSLTPPTPSGRGQAFSYRSRWRCLFPLHTHTHPQRKGVNVASFALKDGDKQQQVLKKEEELAEKGRSAALQIILWAAETVYVVWLFLLPFAPGDPVWAIKPDTVNALLGLSLNFFFILPFANAGRLTSLVFESMIKLSKLGSVMTAGAPIVGLIGGAICLLSTWWAISGRGDGGFGSLEGRLDFFSSYIGSERLAYAFIWDICLYAVFQPWLISENLQNVQESKAGMNVQESKAGMVSILQYIPVVGLVAYLVSLNYDREF